MARCVVCDKGTTTSFNVSHSKRATKRKIFPNVQRIKIVTAKGPRRAFVCTRCIKSGKIERAI